MTKKGGNEPRKPAKKQKGASRQTVKSASGADANFPVVGVGASAGGLEALKELFSHLPADANMAFVVVTHQHPGHVSMLANLLAQRSAIPVSEANEGTRVEMNRVYVAPPGGLLTIAGRTLHRVQVVGEEAKRLPIDAFLRSLAKDVGDRAICIVLSGTGTDGTLGLEAVKGESGMAMVQELRSAQYSGMPSSAAGTGLADYVLAPAEMAKQLLTFVEGPYLRSEGPPTVPAAPLKRVFVHLRQRTGQDFSGYKASTVRRRVERRMNVHGMDRPGDYLKFIEENPHEIDILFKELLIGVTSFFRDPEAFEALAEGPLTELLEARPENHTVRIWGPGCTTGEECFSLAILLREIMVRLNRHFEVQIFGTDLDADAIEAARAGHYPDGIAGDVSPMRLERFFTKEEVGYRIRKEIREMCVFATQNVIKDPPFTQLDMVSCRNLLIYLEPELQRKILPVFHYALRPGGLLFLGPSESIGNLSDLFDPISNKWKIFGRRELIGVTRQLPELPLTAGGSRIEPIVGVTAASAPMPNRPTQFERLLLNWFCPASVVVNDRGDIIHIHGRTGAYLEPAEGRPRLNILEMAREGLQLELSHALREAGRAAKGEVVRENVRIKSNGATVYATVSVTRIQDPEALRGLLVVTFRSVAPPRKEGAKRKRSPAAPDQTEELERELQYTRESLQTTIEELETSNEELKSTNEELQSANEELQSSNEELETSKEEMQSLNEELTTVNAELQSRVEDVAQASDDMQNLLDSTNIATIFLDNELNIKRYTEQAKKIVKLIPSDAGRPIGDLVSRLRYTDLEDACGQVFRTLKCNEVEVRTESGDLYLMRIAPYRTSANVIDGLVVTFVDIAEVYRTSRLAHSLYENIVQTVRQPLVVLSSDLRVMGCNHAFARLSRSRVEELRGKLLFEVGEGAWNVPALRKLLKELLPEKRTLDGFPIELETGGAKPHPYLLNARELLGEGEERAILIAMEEAE